MAYIPGVDVSWPQGNYVPEPGVQFVGVGASSADGASLFVQETYHEQVDNAHAAGLPVIHYFFNGGAASVAACAAYFIANLYHFQPGDVLALDVESWARGTRPAWSPAQAHEFMNAVGSGYGPMGMYGPISVMKQSGWAAVERAGAWLWIAWPGDESEINIGEWSHWTIWQYTISGGVDRNYSKLSLAEISGASAPTTKKVSQMYISYDTSGTGYLHTDIGSVTFNEFGNYPLDGSVGAAQIADLFARLIDPNDPHKFNVEQEKIIEWFQAQIRAKFATPVDVDAIITALTAAVAKLPAPSVDVTAVGKAVAAAVNIPTADENGAAARKAIVAP